MSARLRWKKQPRETGLMAVGAAPRGHDLHDGTKVYARVSPLGGGWRELRGWYWTAGWDSSVPGKNTCEAPVATVEQAKADALAYVKQNLGGSGSE